MEFKRYQLKEICSYTSIKIPVENVQKHQYISTDNMLPNRDGIAGESEIPNNGKVNSFQKGNILISNIRPYFKKIWFADKSGASSPDVLIFEAKNEKVSPEFLYYILSQDNFFDYVMKSSKGTKMPRGDKQAIMKYEAFVFSEKVQKKIVNILESLDKKIAINKELINTIEEISQTLFKNWFIDFEFPNEEGKPYKSSGREMVESELGEIPVNWKVTTISDISKITMGQSPKSDTYNTDKIGLPLLNGAADFKNCNLSPNKYTSDPKKTGNKRDYVFGVRATIGLVTELDNTYAIGRGAGIATPLNSSLKEFVYETLKKAFNEFKYTASGSVYLNISKNDLNDFKLVKPTDKLIEKYHSHMKGILTQKQNLIQENITLKNLRDTLLPKLLSGEIEIPDELEV
ncbi:restriction endonuclease subunit S [Mammaliicoccus sp. A-M2]|uniref:restriction endonuclease subunit S n=1 Tax=Mammaliicoccus sp. A-M2 TaxID=2898662 RepID=UPI001EFA2C7A|nr:restriction endonuclease subunit S [Mammaliicoccus sp. A-M2]